MMKILHTADWQIGKRFGGFETDEEALLAEARLEGVRAIARLAAAEQVDAVLVTGDVFDAQTVSDKTIQQTFRAMEVFEGPWLLMSGNHDAALIESVWSRAQRLAAVPVNIRLCLKPEEIELQNGRAVVFTAPLTQRNTFTDLTDWFDTAQTAVGVIRVGMAHGSVQGVLPDNADSTNPISAGRAVSARLDYLGLGDWHGTKRIDERTWYSGSHEPDRFRNNDAGNVLIVEIDSGALPQVRVVRLGRYRWQSIDTKITVASDVDVLAGELENLTENDVVDLTVRGTCDLVSLDRLRLAISRARGRVRALCSDMSGMQVTPSQEDIDQLHADGYLADAFDELRSILQSGGDDDALASDALVLLATTLRDIDGQGAAR